MNRKFLAVIFLFVIFVLCSTPCFANDNTNLGDELQNSVNKSQDSLENAGQGIQNMAENAGNGIKDVSQDMVNGMQGMAEDIGSGIQNMFQGGHVNNTVTENSNDGTYTATRTSADVTNNSMTNTAWVWLILGITGIVIVALTWYYVSQDNNRH